MNCTFGKDTLGVVEVHAVRQRAVAVEHGGVGVFRHDALLERVETLVLVTAVDELLVLATTRRQQNVSGSRKYISLLYKF